MQSNAKTKVAREEIQKGYEEYLKNWCKELAQDEDKDVIEEVKVENKKKEFC